MIIIGAATAEKLDGTWRGVDADPFRFPAPIPVSTIPSIPLFPLSLNPATWGLGKRHKLPAGSWRSFAAYDSIFVHGWPQFWHDRWWTSVIKSGAQQKVSSSHKGWRGPNTRGRLVVQSWRGSVQRVPVTDMPCCVGRARCTRWPLSAACPTCPNYFLVY